MNNDTNFAFFINSEVIVSVELPKKSEPPDKEKKYHKIRLLNRLISGTPTLKQKFKHLTTQLTSFGFCNSLFASIESVRKGFIIHIDETAADKFNTEFKIPPPPTEPTIMKPKTPINLYAKTVKAPKIILPRRNRKTSQVKIITEINAVSVSGIPPNCFDALEAMVSCLGSVKSIELFEHKDTKIKSGKGSVEFNHIYYKEYRKLEKFYVEKDPIHLHWPTRDFPVSPATDIEKSSNGCPTLFIAVENALLVPPQTDLDLENKDQKGDLDNKGDDSNSGSQLSEITNLNKDFTKSVEINQNKEDQKMSENIDESSDSSSSNPIVDISQTPNVDINNLIQYSSINILNDSKESSADSDSESSFSGVSTPSPIATKRSTISLYNSCWVINFCD